MNRIVPAIRAVVRDELDGLRTIELGTVTQVFTNDGGGGDHNLAVNARLRGSALELQQVPVMVGRLGLSQAPRVGDLAVLAFVGGDLDAAVALGFLYDETNRPPDAGPAEVVYKVPDDEDSAARRLHLDLPNGNSLSVTDGEVTVTMGGTTITVEADGAITMEAAGDLTLKAKGAVKIEAGGAASLKGSTVSVEGQGSATLKAGSISLAGNTSFSPS